MKRLLLAGGGQTHALVLREIARRRIADAEVIVLTPSACLRYSAMLPGWIAGHYTLAELTVDIEPLVRAAGARIVNAQVRRLDLANKMAVTDRGEQIRFDLLSIATGAVADVDAIPGGREHALMIRPFETFITGWRDIMQCAERTGAAFKLAVIGGGAAGVEIALAAAHVARSRRSPMQVTLIAGNEPLLPGHGTRARALMRNALLGSGVQIVDAMAVRVEPRAVITAGNGAHAADATVIAAGASAAAWLRATELAFDEHGLVAVNANLQSKSHPFVFAAGDVAALVETPRPRSGVYAVRAALPLAYNLGAALAEQPLMAFEPPPRALYLMATGAKHAIASWGRWALSGGWAWRWKDRIDRDYIAKLKHP